MSKKSINQISKIVVVIFIILFSTYKVYADDELSINAKSALIVERNTGKIIYEKNINELNYPASTTKILTAIITIENCELEEVVTVSQSAVSSVPSEYIITPLYEGEQIKVIDLLYALMLKSSNDAAYVLAEHVGGSVEEFSNMMNNKAKELGCNNSHFVNPNGIDNPEHYTTAYDMYLIANYAMKNETFAKIVSTYQYTLPATNKYSYSDRIIKNTNVFLDPNSEYYNENVKGIKTGTTSKAGNCLITDFIKDNFDFIIIVLGTETSDSKFAETNRMIEYINENEDVIRNIEVKDNVEHKTDYNEMVIGIGTVVIVLMVLGKLGKLVI